MTDEPVELHIGDVHCPGGRSIVFRMPRARAEAIVAMGLDYWPWYRFEIIHPKGGRMGLAKLLAIVEASLAFARAHRAAIAPLAVLATLAVLGILGAYLPSARHRATPIAAGFLGSFVAGVLAVKAIGKAGP